MCRWAAATLVLALATLSQPARAAAPAQRAEASEPSPADHVRELIQGARYTEAEESARVLLAQAGREAGVESMEAALAIDLLVDALRRAGKVSSAESRELAARAVAIKQRRLGRDDPEVAASLYNLAMVLRDAGDYAAARSAHESALSIRERALGPDHVLVASSLNGLASVLWLMGDQTAARTLTERVLAIREKALGPGEPGIAEVLNNLAILEADAGRRPEALKLHRRALAIRESAWGPEHPLVAESLNNIGEVLRDNGDLSGAARAYERALAIWRGSGGPGHPHTAIALHNLAELSLLAGHTAEARRLIEQAISSHEKTFGPNHPRVAESLKHLSRILWSCGDLPGAIDAALRAESIARDQFQHTARALSEQEALDYEAVRTSGLDVAFSVLAKAGARGCCEDRVWRSWEALARSRAMILDEVAWRSRLMRQPSSGMAGLTAEALVQARDRYARIIVRGPDPDRPSGYSTLVQTSHEEMEEAERDLAEASASFRREREQWGIGPDRIVAALPPDSALVSYARYGTPDDRGGESYLAFVLRGGGSRPVVVSLGPADRIERLARLWRIEAGTLPEMPAAEARYREHGAQLRASIWDPLSEHLSGAVRIFIVPDGILHLVNFGALPAGDGRYLVEEAPRLHYLSAERDLARERPGSQDEGILIIGGPDFDAAPSRLEGRRSATTGARAALHFAPLPGSVAEADAIARLWRRRPPVGGARASDGLLELTGGEASEAAVKELAAGRSIVHLATHGFVHQGSCGVSSQPDREPALVSPREEENPLLLAGLALAGANRRGEADLLEKDHEDGVLTAEEIASLDLSGVEWVVLSACGTGLGQVRAGEGVFGLRRAFQIAGAGTLIMSLWPLPDSAAQQWMTALYDARFKGSSTTEAVRQAAIESLSRRREAGLTTHPFFWGAFVAAGDWR